MDQRSIIARCTVVYFFAPALRGTGGLPAEERQRRASARVTAAAAGPWATIAGVAALGARRPRSDRRGCCLRVGSAHDVDASGFAARPRDARAGPLLSALLRIATAHGCNRRDDRERTPMAGRAQARSAEPLQVGPPVGVHKGLQG